MNTKSVGQKSEAVIIARLMLRDKIVLRPFGDNERYDLVLDDGNGKFSRIQCKTGRLIDGGIRFSTCSSQSHRGKGKFDYRGQIEFFAVYCPETDGVYLIPVDKVGKTGATLRVEKSKRQKATQLEAKDFEL